MSKHPKDHAFICEAPNSMLPDGEWLLKEKTIEKRDIGLITGTMPQTTFIVALPGM
jgi:hypothetical protein